MVNKYCHICGTLVAKVVAGSTMKKNTIMICSDCNHLKYNKSYDKDDLEGPKSDKIFSDLFDNLFKR